VLVSGADSPWGRYIWIPCADGKWRRIKPGIVPLVDVVPDRVVRRSDPSKPFDAENSGEARRMRLKGYGNAISPTLAADFIRACCP
jgi:DNA (cytosine-5)-methyltransferase 1